MAPRFKNAAAGVVYPKTAAYDTLPTNAPAWLAGRPPLTAKQKATMTTDYRKRIEADMATDDMIGHLEQELQARGVADNTYIVFTSDNGYHMGEYRFLPGKQTAFDTDIHVPLVVSGPGVVAGSTATELTSNIDFAPTFESLSGAAAGATVDGLDMIPIWHSQTPALWPQAVLVEHHGPDDNPGDPDRQTKAAADPPSYEAIRTGTALYVRYTDGETEYYNTATDPLELHNLGRSAAPTTVTAALTKPALVAEGSTADVRKVPAPEEITPAEDAADEEVDGAPVCEDVHPAAAITTTATRDPANKYPWLRMHPP